MRKVASKGVNILGEKLVLLEVLGTDKRDFVGDYIVQMNKQTMKKEELRVKEGDFVSLTNKDKKLTNEKKSFPIPILARVHTPDTTVNDDQIRVDQTLRNAIGVRKGDLVVVKKVNVKEGFLKKIVGYQYEVARIGKADPADMEKNICRVPQEVIDVLAIEEGDYVEIKPHEGKPIKLRAFSIRPSSKLECKRGKFKEYNIKERALKLQRNAHRDVGFEAEKTPIIFLDKDARIQLGGGKIEDELPELMPVKIRRDTWHTVYKHLSEVSLALLLAFIGLAIALPAPYSYSLLFFATGFIIYLTFLKMRKRVMQ